MRRRRVGRTDVHLTELGFGAAPIGNLYAEVDDDVAARAVDAAWDAGVRYFDTAPHYGLGLSERRFGDGLSRYELAEWNDRKHFFAVAATAMRQRCCRWETPPMR